MKTGDRVIVVKYGHLEWCEIKKPTGIPLRVDPEGFLWVDRMPELVGKKGVVIDNDNGKIMVKGLGSKSGWFRPEQLELLF